MNNQTVKDVQEKILDIIKFIDKTCRENGIVYYIMGGTALGAVRHGGFIPWDDDLDIFMTPSEYAKFKTAMELKRDDRFILQEWCPIPDYLEHAKVRANGTTFIEKAFKDRRDLHQGIFVDIMILHKVPDCGLIQKIVYYKSKFVTLYGLLQRGWKPKTKGQRFFVGLLKVLPSQFITRKFYQRIYKYDSLSGEFKYCYWITPAKFKQGLFDRSFFEDPVDVPFEDTYLLGSSHIKEYLTYRYGNYMKLPSAAEQKAAVHAMFFDTNKNYTEYLQ